MSTESNLFSQGGGGNKYEFDVQTAYFINFILGTPVQGLDNYYIDEFRQQSGSLGYRTDDLLLKCRNRVSNESNQSKVLIQIKHNLTVSENDLFIEVIQNAWEDFNNVSLFNQEYDRIYIVKSNLTLAEKK